MSPHDPRVLYAGTTRVYQTKNRAKRWKPISPALGGTVRAIGESPAQRGLLFAGTSSGLVWVKKHADEDTWVRSTSGIPARVIGGFAFDRKRPRVAYVSVKGYNSGHVFKTKDQGESFVDISSNLPNAPVHELLYDWRTRTLYAASDVGLFATSNEGKTWRAESRRLPNTMVTDLLLDRRANTLVAATHGRGMWAAKL